MSMREATRQRLENPVCECSHILLDHEAGEKKKGSIITFYPCTKCNCEDIIQANPVRL